MQEKQKVGIFLVLSTRATGKIKKPEYKYILTCKGYKPITDGGTLKDTTGGQLILTCVIEALKRTNKACLITVYTDNKYLLDGCQKLDIWKMNGWKRSGGRPVKNAGLWQQLYTEQKKRSVRYQFENMDKYS